ncbi:MAG: hypothetical protein AB199_02145 [Parcubacteria bacterium C7867-004]|nr:MAG: hypothetical protein AB199_02145 [Parcubacteria bacterium C7867-004]
MLVDPLLVHIVLNPSPLKDRAQSRMVAHKVFEQAFGRPVPVFRHAWRNSDGKPDAEYPRDATVCFIMDIVDRDQAVLKQIRRARNAGVSQIHVFTSRTNISPECFELVTTGAIDCIYFTHAPIPYIGLGLAFVLEARAP